MLTPEQLEKIKAKPEAERTEEEKAALLESNTAAEQKNTEHMVPISRLNEVIKSNKEMADKLAAVEKASKEAEEKRLIEAQNYKGLAEKYQQDLEAIRPKAAVADEMEKTLKSVLDTQIEELPETYRGLIPEELTTQQKLSWLSKNKPLLMKPKPFDIGAGHNGGSSTKPVDLSQEELDIAKKFGMKPEEYAKFKGA